MPGPIRPRTADDALVIGEIAVAALDLDAAKTLIERAAKVLLVGDGIDRAVAVIGPDRPRRSAQQGGQRLARGPAQHIPERHVEARHRHADKALPAEQPESGIHRSHQVERGDLFADEFAADFLDQLHQRPERQPGVGKDIGATANSMIGSDIDQHQRCRADHPEGVFHRP